MNRLHAHLTVKDLDRSVAFDAALFGVATVRLAPVDAKWTPEDPRADVSVSTRGETSGIDLVGLQTDAREDPEAVASWRREAGVGLLEEADATCGCARSNTCRAQSPEGAKRELFRTFDDAKTFGAGPARAALAKAASGPCCGVA